MEIKRLVDRFNGYDTSDGSLNAEQQAQYAETVAAALTLFDDTFTDTVDSQRPLTVTYTGEHMGDHTLIGISQPVYLQASKSGVEYNDDNVAVDTPVMTYRLHVAIPDVSIFENLNYDPATDVLNSSNSTELGMAELSTTWIPSMQTLQSVTDFSELLHEVAARRVQAPDPQA